MVTMKHRVMGTVVGIAVGLLGLCSKSSGATIMIDSESAVPGFGLANMPVTLSLSPGDQVAGAQWDLVFDSRALILYGILNGPAATIAGKSVSFSTLIPGTVRVLVTGFNMNTLPDGVLATLLFSVRPSTSDSVQEISVRNVVLSNPYGVEVSSTGVSGLLTLDAEALPVGGNTWLRLSVACGMVLIPGIIYSSERGTR